MINSTKTLMIKDIEDLLNQKYDSSAQAYEYIEDNWSKLTDAENDLWTAACVKMDKLCNAHNGVQIITDFLNTIR